MREIPTPETDENESHVEDAHEFVNPPEWRWVVPSEFARKLERERDEARKERDEALEKIELLTYSFRFVCLRYCFNKNASQLALEAYAMFRMERQTIQELEQKEEAK